MSSLIFLVLEDSTLVFNLCYLCLWTIKIVIALTYQSCWYYYCPLVCLICSHAANLLQQGYNKMFACSYLINSVKLWKERVLLHNTNMCKLKKDLDVLKKSVKAYLQITPCLTSLIKKKKKRHRMIVRWGNVNVVLIWYVC